MHSSISCGWRNDRPETARRIESSTDLLYSAVYEFRTQFIHHGSQHRTEFVHLSLLLLGDSVRLFSNGTELMGLSSWLSTFVAGRLDHLAFFKSVHTTLWNHYVHVQVYLSSHIFFRACLRAKGMLFWSQLLFISYNTVRILHVLSLKIDSSMGDLCRNANL